MAYHVLTNEGNVIVRSTVVYLTKDKTSVTYINEQMNKYNSQIDNKIGNYSHYTSKLTEYKNDDLYSEIFEDDSTSDNYELCSW